MSIMPPSSSDLIFSRVFVCNRDRVWVLSQEKDLIQEEARHTKFLQLHNDSWIYRRINWDSSAICGTDNPGVQLFVIGVDGEVLNGSTGGFSEEMIDSSHEGPRSVGYMRDARYIDGKCYVVGMGRMAYRREEAGAWNRIDAGVRASKGELAGFNSVDGMSVTDIYAVGYSGEMWRYDGAFWIHLDSPTNVALYRVVCDRNNNMVICCGAGGVVLAGSGDNFVAVGHDVTEDNLYGLEIFKGKVYLASLTKVYVLEGGGLVEQDLGLGDGLTTGCLHAGDGVLWSAGANHLVYTDDGVLWKQVFYTGA
ncbi:hypothetical protein HOP52_06920 [Halomonas campisalis]|uniref:Uncharacterized protein n=1 Tax=Billgrantia campisalis TaxID=74661 RepID=A0ABS9P6T6_9GAMM|nr:hypothetical protein [Halomonas campisalis]MCG6657497.1 hypothetical protein [Halomonas campisalis]MDR5863156.1 hypothetical protein [Halomonas campisalis]